MDLVLCYIYIFMHSIGQLCVRSLFDRYFEQKTQVLTENKRTHAIGQHPVSTILFTKLPWQRKFFRDLIHSNVLRFSIFFCGHTDSICMARSYSRCYLWLAGCSLTSIWWICIDCTIPSERFRCATTVIFKRILLSTATDSSYWTFYKEHSYFVSIAFKTSRSVFYSFTFFCCCKT